MRNISDEIQTILASNNIRGVNLVSIGWDTPVYLTDAPYDITFDGNLYDASGGLVGLAPPQLSQDINRTLYRVVLADPTHTYRDLLNQDYTGLVVKVTALFYDDSDELITDSSFTAFEGYTVSAKSNTDHNVAVVELQVASRLVKLDNSIARFTNANSQQQADSDDTSMDHAHTPEGEVQLLWGRAK